MRNEMRKPTILTEKVWGSIEFDRPEMAIRRPRDASIVSFRHACVTAPAGSSTIGRRGEKTPFDLEESN